MARQSLATKKEVRELIQAGWARMSPRQRRLWEAIRIEPEQWAQHPYGDAGAGFRVLALSGRG